MMTADVAVLATTRFFLCQTPCLPGLLGEPLGVSLIARLPRRHVLQAHKPPNIFEGGYSHPLQDLHCSALWRTKQSQQQILGVDPHERMMPVISVLRLVRKWGHSGFDLDLHYALTAFFRLFNGFAHLLYRHAQFLQPGWYRSLLQDLHRLTL